MTMEPLMIISEGLENCKRGTRTRRHLMIMSEGPEAGKKDQADKNAYDRVRGFDELEQGH